MSKKIDNTILDKEEKQILEDLEKWLYKSVENLEEEKVRLQSIAKYNINKRKAINIRPLEVDIVRIKAKADTEWVPYQTLINSVIHKYATGQLVQK